MKWQKKGLIFALEGSNEWSESHAQVPIVDKISEDRLRIYFGTRDKQNRTLTTYIEVDADNLQRVLYIHNCPLLSLGALGTFDDRGVMPSWIINHGKSKYLYYTGWNIGSTVSYRLAIGLAVSHDDGKTFKRYSNGPILDRSAFDPCFVSNPCVLRDGNIWKMWYLSCTKWENIAGRPEPYYHIKYAESEDGIYWSLTGQVSVDLKNKEEGGISRPCVIKEGTLYRMWYSYRGASDYRKNKTYSYRIGYAESKDGMIWTRKDELAGIDISQTGWDSEMIAYPHVYTHKGQKYMLYNGNGFGKTGFGYATLNEI